MGNTNQKPEVTKAFTWFHATSVNGGAMAIAATIATYFSLYVQETIGITAAQLAIIMFICTLWDAINDPIMGVICDSVTPKWGRYRTWFTFTPVFLLVDMFLLFSNPGFIQGSATAKCVYVCITYMFYGMIVTAYTMPQMAILPAMTKNDQERNGVIAKGAGVCALMFTIASTFSTQLVEIFGSYRRLMCFYAIFAVISFWGLYKTSEERYVLPKDPNTTGIKQLGYVFRHKEVWPVMLCWCLASISYGFMFTSSVYYAQYILAADKINAGLATGAYQSEEEIGAFIGSTIGSTISTYMGFISVGALLSMVVLMPIFLRTFKTGWKTLLVSQIGTVICYVILFFTGRFNFWYCCILSLVATVIGAMVNAVVNVLVNDTIDFILLKEGKQLSGVVSSVKGFAQKCGNTVTNSGMLAILALCGFDAQNGPLGQVPSAIIGTNVVRFLVPAIVSGIIIVLMVFYPIRKYFPEIEAMKAKMHATGEQEA
ncbi:Na+/melibiose symporter [Pseudobutyrivibrio sp. ACV-2]|uniref:MFS transporter n=1 Tax=Pseudobutyrivibrio sp. ACV-2 TaxID=1520801 RepID=UPI000897DD6E|nr:MFS transporter [Pseudobutyrivibrio sp. ACV-2]SEA27054.1 Na+/melibiose symporter [Pseudobutyrivibrio sp. ACV-2]